MRTSLKEHYQSESDRLSLELLKLKSRSKYFIFAEILLFAVFAGVSIAYVADTITFLPFVIIFNPAVALFIVVKYFDRQTGKAVDQTEAWLWVVHNEQKYLNGDFSPFDNGKRYTSPEHQYSYDMDLFGEGSLFNRICRCATTGGADRLADILAGSALPFKDGVTSFEDIVKRSKSVCELAELEDWRTAFIAAGHKGKVDTEAVIYAVRKMEKACFPWWARSRTASLVVYVSIAVFIVLFLLAVFSSLSADIVCMWAVLQLSLGIGVSAKAIKEVNKVIGIVAGRMKAYISLMTLVSEQTFREEYNIKAWEALKGKGNDALSAMKELDKIVDSLDRRANVLGLIIFNAVGYSDFFLVRRFVAWRDKNVENMEQWIDAVSEIDARVSMATMRFNEPQAVTADVVSDDKIVYEATSLSHPFLGEKAVGNDFSIKDGNYYIITGANMAGKSTFLRSLGINYILAMCGMPVFANSLKVSVFNLFSSMRTSDDLNHGVSYFNAELLRLKSLLCNVKKAPRTLIILDEILKGTNSLDKLNGSRMFLEAISEYPVSGIIATHDLELSRMEDEYPERFHNFCFEIKLSDKISYSYKITPGVAKNQNATYLLKEILKPS